MLKKIKQAIANWRTRRAELSAPVQRATQEVFTREEVIQLLAETRHVAYNDGKRDGLSIAREQATKSLKEILWQQNQQKTK